MPTFTSGLALAVLLAIGTGLFLFYAGQPSTSASLALEAVHLGSESHTSPR